METFAEKLRILRGQKSQKVFSDELGLTQRSLSRYETGQSSPDIKLLQRICDVLGVEPKWLVLGKGPAYQGIEERFEEDREKIHQIEIEGVLTIAGMKSMIKVLEKKLAEAREAERSALIEAKEAYKMALENVIGDISRLRVSNSSQVKSLEKS